ncbi:MAG: cysteine methyltransferase [Acidobacteria bacterium CG_4_9_14_3_um_filter_49_7]|nr:MAG: cysteine methyltransferase [Acidobacteria bacterium CG_4_9_14_3_um_filter_49_7]
MPDRPLFLELTERKGQLVRLEFRRGVMPPTGPSPSSLLRDAARELHAYFEGKLTGFSVPLQVEGTAFQTSVWTALQNVPYGKTVSYGELAAQIGKPKAARAIGGAVGKNPIPIIIPCHRVLAAGGKLGGFTGGTDIKEWLLAIEGIRG